MRFLGTGTGRKNSEGNLVLDTFCQGREIRLKTVLGPFFARTESGQHLSRGNVVSLLSQEERRLESSTDFEDLAVVTR